ncbi:MAG: hypothetical protein A4S09_01825 [Proteobacteria bacterium SG_bin7]|nr:MAG: hypothetical protein A4S09_01825 [Proteobacteria bacterium SG_bin7]
MKIFIPILSIGLSGCAVLHHVQIGDIESNDNFVLKPIELKISESGVNLGEIKAISKAVLDKNRGDDAGKIADFIALFQMGPRTGNPVYVDNYTKHLINNLYEACPSGRITGLVSIRETRKYPVVSGEIVKIKGYCMLPKKGSA